MSISDWSKPFGGFTVSRVSRAGGRNFGVAMPRLWNLQRHHKRVPFVNIASLPSRSIKRCQWKRKMDYYGVVFAHLATGCGINAKDPSGLDSDQWIPHSRCCENSARALAQATSQRYSPIWIQPLGGLSPYNITSKMMSILSQPLCINPRTLLSILLLWRISSSCINLLWWNCFGDNEKVLRCLPTFYRTQEHAKLNSLRPRDAYMCQ